MGCSVGFKYAKNALAAGAPPPTPMGELTTPVPMPHPLGAFGASMLVPHVEAWCPR